MNEKEKVRIVTCELTGRQSVVWVDKNGHVRQYAVKTKIK